jgi:hypothetical protein
VNCASRKNLNDPLDRVFEGDGISGVDEAEERAGVEDLLAGTLDAARDQRRGGPHQLTRSP